MLQLQLLLSLSCISLVVHGQIVNWNVYAYCNNIVEASVWQLDGVSASLGIGHVDDGIGTAFTPEISPTDPGIATTVSFNCSNSGLADSSDPNVTLGGFIATIELVVDGVAEHWYTNESIEEGPQLSEWSIPYIHNLNHNNPDILHNLRYLNKTQAPFTPFMTDGGIGAQGAANIHPNAKWIWNNRSGNNIFFLFNFSNILSAMATDEPTTYPTSVPSLFPTSQNPSAVPSMHPSMVPTSPPSSLTPSAGPSMEPSMDPSPLPTYFPTSCDFRPNAWFVAIPRRFSPAELSFRSQCSAAQVLDVDLYSMIEKDAYGRQTANAITNINQNKGYYTCKKPWTENTEDSIQGIDAVTNTYQSIMKMQGSNKWWQPTPTVNLTLRTAVFSQQGSIDIGTIVSNTVNGTAQENENAILLSQPVFENTLKWSIQLVGWPFLEPNHTVEVCFQLKSKQKLKNTHLNGSDTEFHWNDFYFNVPNLMQCNAESVFVNRLSKSAFKSPQQRNKFQLCVTFDYCRNASGASVIEYDPFVKYNHFVPTVVASSHAANDAVDAEVISIVSVGSVLALLCCALIMGDYYWRKKFWISSQASAAGSQDQQPLIQFEAISASAMDAAHAAHAAHAADAENGNNNGNGNGNNADGANAGAGQGPQLLHRFTYEDSENAADMLSELNRSNVAFPNSAADAGVSGNYHRMQTRNHNRNEHNDGGHQEWVQNLKCDSKYLSHV